MAEPAETRPVEPQQLAAPGPAVAAEAEPVQHHGQRRRRHAVFGQHGGGMGVVVLHGEHRHPEPLRQAAGRKIRVQVVRDQHRRDVQQMQQVAHRFVEEPQRRRVVQRADMLRQHRLGAAGGAGGGLQHAAEGQHRRHRTRQGDAARGEAAGAAQEARRAVDHAHHAVVAARHHRAVMRHHQIGDAGEPCAGVVIVDDQRLAAGIGAGGDQQQIVRRVEPGGAGGAAGGFVEQQEVQRGGGEHEAERVEAWG